MNNIKVADPEEMSPRLSCIGGMVVNILNLENLVDP